METRDRSANVVRFDRIHLNFQIWRSIHTNSILIKKTKQNTSKNVGK